MRCSENGVFVNSLYVLQDGELTTAPPVQKTLPEKPGYLFRLTLGLCLDFGGDRTAVLDLPASEESLAAAQEQLGTLNWENTVVLNYDGILPNAAFFVDLPADLEAFNEFAKAVQDMPFPEKQLPKLKALLEQFEVQAIETAMLLTEYLADYILMPNLSSPQEAALDQLCFIMDREEAVRLIPYVNLFNYFKESRKAEEKVAERREKIEGELPRFVATVEQELGASRDVLTILENYKRHAGPDFARELDVLTADMRSSSYEAALVRFEGRLASPMLSDIVRGLIGVLRGDDGRIYFQMLSHDMKQLELQRLKAQAAKIPPKIRVYSFVMLVCFMLIYIVVFLMQILTSMGGLFG